MKKLCSLFLAVLLTAGVLPLRALAADGGMTTSDAGVDFIIGFEGYRQYAYEDGGSWYIGYGTACEEDEYPDGVTEEEAEQLLRDTLSEMEERVNLFLLRYGISLEQHQPVTDALLLFQLLLQPGQPFFMPAVMGQYHIVFPIHPADQRPAQV